MISLTHIFYGTLTPKFIRGYLRSLEIKKRPNLKKEPTKHIFCMDTHMISLSNMVYDVMTQTSLEVIGGTGGQKEVKFEKCVAHILM